LISQALTRTKLCTKWEVGWLAAGEVLKAKDITKTFGFNESVLKEIVECPKLKLILKKIWQNETLLELLNASCESRSAALIIIFPYKEKNSGSGIPRM
jgi:hypothetical protein